MAVLLLRKVIRYVMRTNHFSDLKQEFKHHLLICYFNKGIHKTDLLIHHFGEPLTT